MLGRLIAVRHQAGPLAVQILIQRTAERDVEDLNAAADRENRQAARARRGDERELGGVTHGIDIAQAGMRRRPVAVRRDVFATREHQPTDRREGGSGTVGGHHCWTARGTRPAVSSARTYAVFSVTRSRPSTIRRGAVTATG